MFDLHSLALDSISGNIINIDDKFYITAGSTQFHTVWIRDFGYSTDTLHKLGLDAIIDDTVELYLKHLIKDSNGYLYGPKCFDSMNPEARVVFNSIRYTIGMSKIKYPIKKLKPYFYKDSRNSVAIDSNVMICLAALTTGIYKKHIHELLSLLEWYSSKKNNIGLIVQGGYSDFQDSQRRQGVVFNINLLYYVCVSKYKKLGHDIGINLKELKNNIISTFYDPVLGIFKTQQNEKYICLLDNLLAIKYDFSDSNKLYKSLKKSKLWGGSNLKLPGFPCYPSNNDVHIQVKFGNLNDYHNDLYWGWLMAFSATIAFKMGDKKEGIKIYNKIIEMASRDIMLFEIYRPEHDMPAFISRTYKAEENFTMFNCHAINMCNELSTCSDNC